MRILLLLLVLITTITIILNYPLLKYTFKDNDVILDGGDHLGYPVSLHWNVNKRFPKQDYGVSVFGIKPTINSFFQSDTGLINWLKPALLHENNITLFVNLTIEIPEININSEFCLFCLMNTIKEINFGIMWNYKYLEFILKTSHSDYLNNHIYINIENEFLNKKLNVQYYHNNNEGLTKIIINNKDVFSKKTSDAYEDFSNWHESMNVFIGTIKPSEQHGNMEVILLYNMELYDYYPSPIINKRKFYYKTNNNQKKSYQTITTNKLDFIKNLVSTNNNNNNNVNLNDCKYDSCGVCNGDNLKCSTLNQQHIIETSKHCIKENTKCFLTHMNYKNSYQIIFNVISINADDQLQIKFKCLTKETSLKLSVDYKILEKHSKLCNNNEQQIIILKNLTYSNIEECFGNQHQQQQQQQKNIDGIINIMMMRGKTNQILYSVPCHLQLSTTDSVVQSTTTTNSIDLRTSQKIINFHQEALYVIYETCYYYSAHTKELQNIVIDYQSTPELLQILDVSKCFHNVETLQCCHHWTLKSNDFYYQTNYKLIDELKINYIMDSNIIYSSFLWLNITKPPPLLDVINKNPVIINNDDNNQENLLLLELYEDEQLTKPLNNNKLINNKKTWMKLYLNNDGDCSREIKLVKLNVCILPNTIKLNESCFSQGGQEYLIYDNTFINYAYAGNKTLWNSELHTSIRSNCPHSVIILSFTIKRIKLEFINKRFYFEPQLKIIPTNRINNKIHSLNSKRQQQQQQQYKRFFNSFSEFNEDCQQGLVFDQHFTLKCVTPFIERLFWFLVNWGLISLFVFLLLLLVFICCCNYKIKKQSESIMILPDQQKQQFDNVVLERKKRRGVTNKKRRTNDDNNEDLMYYYNKNE